MKQEKGKSAIYVANKNNEELLFDKNVAWEARFSKNYQLRSIGRTWPVIFGSFWTFLRPQKNWSTIWKLIWAKQVRKLFSKVTRCHDRKTRRQLRSRISTFHDPAKVKSSLRANQAGGPTLFWTLDADFRRRNIMATLLEFPGVAKVMKDLFYDHFFCLNCQPKCMPRTLLMSSQLLLVLDAISCNSINSSISSISKNKSHKNNKK